MDQVPVVKKSISKELLFGEYESAQRECAIHSQLDHPNIIKMLAYTETEKDFVIILEHCNQANYVKESVLDC